MKKVFLTIAIVLVAFIGFGLFQASKIQNLQIIKSVTIKGSQKEVFDMVRYLNNFPKWSPFLAADPTQKYEVKGIDGARRSILPLGWKWRRRCWSSDNYAN